MCAPLATLSESANIRSLVSNGGPCEIETEHPPEGLLQYARPPDTMHRPYDS